MPDLQLYLDRIGFTDTPRADIATLKAIHRAHALSIPYENLDVQMRTPVSRALPAIFEKIVGRGRGGWCYEMNGLLSWALEEIGFSVRRLAGGVHREGQGDNVVGNHLVLLVDVAGETWLADVGFGDGLIEPAPLEEGAFQNGPLQCALQRVEGGWWRYSNDSRGSAPSFDFHPDVHNEALLERGCRFLQTDPASPFVLNAVVQRWSKDAHRSLRGRVLTTISSDGKESRLVGDAAAYVRLLTENFGLDLPEAGALWPQIEARHEQILREKAASPA